MADLTFIRKTDKELFELRFQPNYVGKMARKEIQRRKCINFKDGSLRPEIEESAWPNKEDGKIGWYNTLTTLW